MAYCDYGFYKNEYLGNVVAEADFPRLAERASEKIDMLTFERIEEVDGRIVVCNSSGNRLAAGDKLEKKIKKAVCAIAEVYGDIETMENADRQSVNLEKTEEGLKGQVISSITSGSQSISYKTGTSGTISAEQLKDRAGRERLLYEKAREYLTGTGLLYAGM